MNERTPQQKIIEKALNQLGFQTELEVLFPPFQADIFCGELELAIEVDGDWHKNWKKRDKKRDQFLLDNYGFNTIRISNTLIDACENDEEVKELLKNCLRLDD